MAHDFDFTDCSLAEEARKHPGIVAGTIAILAGVGFATLFLRQRTGPRRIEVIRERLDPRGWVDTRGLRARFGQFDENDFEDEFDHRAEKYRRRAARAKAMGSAAVGRAADLGHDVKDRAVDLGFEVKDRAQDVQDRALDLADSVRQRFEDWRGSSRHGRKGRRYAKKARRAAEDARDYATDFAKDHAREGAALFAVALIAAAIGAVALEHKRVSGQDGD